MTRARDEAKRSLWAQHQRIAFDGQNYAGLEVFGIPTTAKIVRARGFVRTVTNDATLCVRVGIGASFAQGASAYGGGYLYGDGAQATSQQLAGNTAQCYIGIGGRNDMPQVFDLTIARNGGARTYTLFHCIASTWRVTAGKNVEIFRSGFIADSTITGWDSLQFITDNGNFADAHFTVEYSRE